MALPGRRVLLLAPGLFEDIEPLHPLYRLDEENVPSPNVLACTAAFGVGRGCESRHRVLHDLWWDRLLLTAIVVARPLSERSLSRTQSI